MGRPNKSGKGDDSFPHGYGKGSKGGKGDGISAHRYGKGGKGGRYRSDTLPVVTAHMRHLLALPADVRAACSECVPHNFTRAQPAPVQHAERRQTVLCTLNL